MHTEVLNKDQLDVLKLFAQWTPFPFDLGGGTAIALYYGHRKSIDFYFFSPKPLDLENLNIDIKKHFPFFKPNKQSSGTIIGTNQNVSLSFFEYLYPKIAPEISTPWGFSCLSMEDLAAMKIEAIAERGSRKDFIDVYWLMQNSFSLKSIFQFCEVKFKESSFDPYHRFRSLLYFDDAEKEPMPVMLKPFDWSKMKLFFQKEVKNLWDLKKF